MSCNGSVIGAKSPCYLPGKRPTRHCRSYAGPDGVRSKATWRGRLHTNLITDKPSAKRDVKLTSEMQWGLEILGVSLCTLSHSWYTISINGKILIDGEWSNRRVYMLPDLLVVYISITLGEIDRTYIWKIMYANLRCSPL